MKEKPNCRSCYFMKSSRIARVTKKNNCLRGPRASCFCTHPDAEKKFEKMYPHSPRMPGFIGFTKPGENKPTTKTSPKWCPLHPGDKGD